MRNLLYVAGALLTVFGALTTFDSTSDGTSQIVKMLVVVCGVVLISAGAIVGAIDALRRPAPLPFSLPTYPIQPGPPFVQG